jgi:hypothetical protein
MRPRTHTPTPPRSSRHADQQPTRPNQQRCQHQLLIIINSDPTPKHPARNPDRPDSPTHHTTQPAHTMEFHDTIPTRTSFPQSSHKPTTHHHHKTEKRNVPRKSPTNEQMRSPRQETANQCNHPLQQRRWGRPKTRRPQQQRPLLNQRY